MLKGFGILMTAATGGAGTRVGIAACVLILAALLIYTGTRLARRFGKPTTVDAVFLHEAGSVVNTAATDRARMAKEGASIALENHILCFESGENGEELRFSVSGDCRTWPEGKRGKLTYSGKRFIEFKAE